ncbi:MAG: hypothetical protein NC340_10260 [Ruminococcus flavefaciens]|nr:hypothetical protein [Ruminococcus flavefaciens]MCM1229838.1 hypothetical protein [Ruminococcus flavefaciens]
MSNDDNIINLILAEMNRLDGITGEKASDLPIILQDSDHIVGQYVYNPENQIKEYFTFSRFFFGDSVIEKSTLIHIIRHEYSHFLNFHWYRQRGHGFWFQYCCRMLDCTPDSSVFANLRAKQSE